MKTKANTLKKIKQSLESVVPREDGRSNIGPLGFLINLIFCYSVDTKKSSLTAIRRSMMSNLKISISNSAFWERLSGKRLNRFLLVVVSTLMAQLSGGMSIGMELLPTLGVSGIFLVDSCSFSLWDGAKKEYPGTFTTAGIKWHVCFNLLSGKMNWFEFTSTSIHDSDCFPRLKLFKGQLLIFDLGYWDFSLLLAIDQAHGYFLSRVKNNAVIPITKIISGLPQTYRGKSITVIKLRKKNNKKHKDLVEVMIERRIGEELLCSRAIGFWNPIEYRYHWYLTNLTAPAKLMYSLYRLRWQIELIFKGSQQSLNANRLTSNNSTIIENLLLASLAAQLISMVIWTVGSTQLNPKQKLARSFQRIAKIAAVLATDFVNFFCQSNKKVFDELVEKILLFTKEIFDPNYQHRETSLMRLSRELIRDS